MSAAECNQISFEFSSSDKRKVQADFSGGAVSSNGGLILVAEIEKQLKLSKRISAILPDHRNPDKITHTQESMIHQRLMGLCAAHEDLNPHISPSGFG